MKDGRAGRPDTAALPTGTAAKGRTAHAGMTSRRKALLALAGVAGLITAVQMGSRMRAADSTLADLRIHPRPRDLPPLRFADANAAPTSLAAFRGRMVLLNVWATWCPPCIKEMSALDRLQATLGGPHFEVVALSIDEGGAPVVRSFFLRNGIKRLHPYIDTFREAMTSLAGAGIPLTLLVDPDGREIGRKRGPAEWDRPASVQLMQRYLDRAAG